MGKKGGGKAPAAPDPFETAKAESQFNRLDTYGPNGASQVYGYTDPSGNFVRGSAPKGQQAAVQSIESPLERAMRGILEPASMALTQRVVTDNIAGMPAAARVGDRGTVAKSIFDRNMSMMQPSIDKGNTRLLGNLQARGIPIGSTAFNEAYGAQQRETQDTISRLAMDADTAAGAEQTRQFGLDQAQRGNAISELVAAMGGGYAAPTNLPSANAPSVNYSGLVGDKYKADQANYNQQQQQKSAGMSALGSMGSALLMKCTEAAKDIHGTLPPGLPAAIIGTLPLHIWSYKPGEGPEGDIAPHFGPMAEDFQRISGLGDGKTISVIDMLGLLSGALQDALARIIVLERIVDGEDLH